ncbi:MAG: hypothetical protein MJY50_05610 [Bacteroidales bacterium]|nr:hypothetical protein [Bacteroidales bacterium]
MSKTKFNVLIGVLTGVLVGFVLGAAFGVTDGSLSTGKGNASGNINRVAAFGNYLPETIFEEEDWENEEADTLRYEALDENGEPVQIIIVNNK